MIKKIIQEIKSLPPLPKSVQKIEDICNDPEETIKSLILAVKGDPVFTTDVLKMANSPLYGFNRQITSIDQAVSLFGMKTIQKLGIAYAMRENFSTDLGVYSIATNNLIKISTMQNALANSWGKPQVSTHKDELITLSLIMELGKIVAAKVIEKDNKAKIFKEDILGAQTFKEIVAIEKEYLTISSDQINALMLKYWKFNKTMISIMQHIIEPKKADESTRKHSQILRVIKEAIPTRSPLSSQSIKLAIQRAKEYELDYQSLNDAIKTVTVIPLDE